MVRKALNEVICSLKVFAYIRLRVFANQRYECRVAFPGVFLRIVAGYHLKNKTKQ